MIKNLFLRRLKTLQIWNEHHIRWKTAPRNTTKMLTAWIFSEKKLWADLWTKNHYKKKLRFSLNLSWRRSLLYRNQSIDLLWFLYDRDNGHERVINKERDIFRTLLSTYGETFWQKWFKKAKMAKSQFQYLFWMFFGFSRPFSTKCSVCCF